MKTLKDDIQPEELDDAEEDGELLDEVRQVNLVLARLLTAALQSKPPVVQVTNQPPEIPDRRAQSATIVSHRPDGSQYRYEITFHYEK